VGVRRGNLTCVWSALIACLAVSVPAPAIAAKTPAPKAGEKPHPASTFSVHAVPANSAPSLKSGATPHAAAAPGAPSSPFNQCPAVGADSSCELLIDITDSGTIVYQDPSVGPYDSAEDTLIGVQNRSSTKIGHLSLSSNTDLFGFDGDGLCYYGVSGCPFGSTGYEGPQTSFSNISANASGGEVDFAGGLAPGATAYFSLEEALDSTSVVSGGPGAPEQGGPINLAERSTTCSVGLPVNCATGTFWHTFTDVQIPGNGPPLELERTYSSSQAGTDGRFGHGWSDSYAMHLSTDPSGAVNVVQEDGSQVTFTPKGNGTFGAPPRVLASLADNGDGTYTFTRNRDHVANVFDAATGDLDRQVDLNGSTTTLSYSSGHLTSVTDSAGRHLTFGYTGNHVTSATDPAGKQWSYEYDSDGNLSKTTDPLGRSWSFTYDAQHLLLTMTDPRGGTTTNVYDGSDRVTDQTDAAGRKTEWSYSGDNASPGGGSTDVTNPRGAVTRYAYTNLELESVTRAYGTADASTTSYQYDAATLGVTSKTDPNGHVTSNTYDQRGNLLSSTDPLGHTSYYSYNGFDEVATYTDPRGVNTYFGYDSGGNRTSKSTSISTGGSATWLYAYGSGASAGERMSSTNPEGKTTTYGYDDAGDVTSITDPLGHKTTNEYDADGRLTSTTSPGGHETGYEYDGDGQLTKTTNPLGRSTTYGYDDGGNRIGVTDVKGHTTTYSYDADNEQTKITRPDGSTKKTEYDDDGNVSKQIDGRDNSTAYSYDLLDRVTDSKDANGHDTANTYDGAGNLVTRTNPSGDTTTLTYDADDRVIGIEYSDGTTPDVTERYDEAGNRTSLEDGTGTSNFSYDSLGRLTSQTNGAGSGIAYGYDAAGDQTSIAYPNGQSVSQSYDDDGRLASLTDWLGHTTEFDYDADGNLADRKLPGDVTSHYGYDDAGQLTGIGHERGGATLAGFSYTRDALGQLSEGTSTGSAVDADHHTFGYDSQNRLTGDNATSYGYDSDDNPTTYVNGATQTFSPANELLSSEPAPPGGGDSGSGSGGGGGPIGGGGTPGGQPATAPGVGSVVSTRKLRSHRVLRATGITNKAAGGLVLALVAVRKPSARAVAASKPSGGGLAWTLVARRGSGRSAVAIWKARAATKLSNATVKTRVPRHTTEPLLTVVAFEPGAALAGHSQAAGTSSSPRLTLNAPAHGFMWAIGNQVTGKHRGISWVQRATGSQARAVTLHGKRPGRSRTWALAAATVRPDTAVHISMSSKRVSGLVDASAKRTFTYDDQGNRTSVKAGGTTTYLSYDQANRLVSISGGTVYAYDGDSLRTSKTIDSDTTQFTWGESGSLPLLLQEAGTSYIYGPGGQPVEQVTDGDATFLLANQQGSTRLLTDSSGNVTGTYDYDPWGNVTKHTGSATTNLQYDGQYTDTETGYQYLRARYYDPSTGQFVSADPAVTFTRTPYGYGLANPLNVDDPLGLFSWSHTLKVAGAVVGVVGLAAAGCVLTACVGDAVVLGGIATTATVTTYVGFGIDAASLYVDCKGGGTRDCYETAGQSAIDVATFGYGKFVGAGQVYDLFSRAGSLGYGALTFGSGDRSNGRASGGGPGCGGVQSGASGTAGLLQPAANGTLLQ
jgi:RHS repeat-associated protein